MEIAKDFDVVGGGVITCHPHDGRWVEEQLNLLPAPMRAAIAQKYSKTYLLTLEAHEGTIAPENRARREANTRLRHCINTYGSAYHGAVVAPGE